ncbi:MAG: PEGA domain-containing protein [Candidatus Korobacteraceae bacterium]
MHSTGRPIWAFLFCLVVCVATFAQNQPTPQPSTTDKPRVFITDSQSWEMSGAGGGANGTWGAATSGGARPQTAEIVKTFGERCPQVMVNNKQDMADYIVLLDHEGGKGLLRHKDKVAVFQKISGDVVVSHSTMSLGGSVKDACEGITKDWSAHAIQIRAAATKPPAPAPSVAPVADVSNKSATIAKISVASTPDGADIEIDGSFVGNTPSVVELAPGEHVVIVKKAGYKPWERKLKVSGGEIKLTAELEK